MSTSPLGPCVTTLIFDTVVVTEAASVLLMLALPVHGTANTPSLVVIVTGSACSNQPSAAVVNLPPWVQGGILTETITPISGQSKGQFDIPYNISFSASYSYAFGWSAHASNLLIQVMSMKAKGIAIFENTSGSEQIYWCAIGR